VKFSYKSDNPNIPTFAIGLDDFAGTGTFSKEYAVMTSNYDFLKLSMGIGWGTFAGFNSFDNPISFLSKNLDYRPEVSDYKKSTGGNPQYDKWFRGNASLFGGIEIFVPKGNGLKLKLELDPLDYNEFSALNRVDAIYQLRKKDSKYNIGISYPYNDYLTLSASYIKGNTFNLSFTIGATFNDKLTKKPTFRPEIDSQNKFIDTKKSFYSDLLLNLNKNNLLLQTASLTDSSLRIAISTSDHRNSIRASSRAAFIANKVLDEYSFNIASIDVNSVNVGIGLNTISYKSRHLNAGTKTPYEVIKNQSEIFTGNGNGYLDNEFKPKVSFPVIFSSTSPTIVSHIGSPEKFYFGGVALQNVSEIQFSRKLLLSTELLLSVANNFENTIVGPSSKMEHVRTDIVEYLKNGTSYINRMQLDYIWSPRDNLYAKISGGIFEQMYGGIGGEILFIPFDGNFSLGFESYYVKKRDFDQRFNFLDYSTHTSHINFNYDFFSGLELNLSYGRYLAKDDGFTFDISKNTKSGFKAGVYITRTDVPSELFGEGSFDKGFYFQIPFDLFTNSYSGNYTNFRLSPLTRDGGAKLMSGKQLKGLMYNTSRNKVMGGWNGFLN